MIWIYELRRAELQFMWILLGADRETILTSELYQSRSGAMSAISACRACAALDARYERATSSAGQPYFAVRGASDEIIATSRAFPSASERDRCIEACKALGPTAALVDRT